MVINITNDKLEKVENISVLKFSADWCKPCKANKKDYENLSYKLSNVNFYEIDVEDNDDIVKEFKIKNVPTFIVLTNLTKKIVKFEDIEKYIADLKENR